MSFSFEEAPNLDTAGEVSDETLVADYDELFGDADFKAMGVNPSHGTASKPGSDDKVVMLAARYAAGLPLWHDSDCYDHGPSRSSHELDLT